MSGHKSRVTALQALVTGTQLPAADITRIVAELNQVFESGRVRRLPRRLLLQVIHSSRALDSTLSGLIMLTGGQRPDSIGKALHYLMVTGLNGNRLTKPLRNQYQSDIVVKRNTYMHEAGAFPANAAEIAQLLADMQSCFTDVIALW
jgi:hypothetical protein